MLKIKKKNRRAWLCFAVFFFALVAIDRFYAFNFPANFVYEQYHKGDKDKQQPYRTNSLILARIAEFEEFLEAHEKLLMVLATGAIAWFTATLWRATAGMFIIARGQAKDMKDSIEESARAATGIEELAKATKANADRMESVLHRQMRAYISVDTGTPTCQDENLRFGGAPVMVNTGLTPARNVRHKIKAEILDLSDDVRGEHKFDDAEVRNADAALASRQSLALNVIAAKREPDTEVPAIMRGDRKRLFVWGTVTYEDIFGKTWETNFCHNFVFFKEKNSKGEDVIKFLAYYYRAHNDAT